jgi:hypothetical protein
MLTGRTVAQANFLASAPISSVKEEVHAAAAIPVRHQRLVWQDDVLADDRLLSDLALPSSNAVLVLVVSLPPAEAVEEARRAITAARACLDTLSVSSFSELKNLHMPPCGVSFSLQAVMELLAGISTAIEVDSRGRLKDRSWKASRKLIKDPRKFLGALCDFPNLIDNGRVPKRNIDAARTIRDGLGEDFSRDKMRAQSFAAGGVCSWVLNIITYYDIVTHIRADFEGFDIMAEIGEQLGQ